MKKILVGLFTMVSSVFVCVYANMTPNPSSTQEETVCKYCNGSTWSDMTKDCDNCSGRTIQKIIDCPTCHGSGLVHDQHGEHRCPQCDGAKKIIHSERCSVCNGSGEVRMKCLNCKGKGTVKQ